MNPTSFPNVLKFIESQRNIINYLFRDIQKGKKNDPFQDMSKSFGSLLVMKTNKCYRDYKPNLNLMFFLCHKT